jgi:hypothetical protein
MLFDIIHFFAISLVLVKLSQTWVFYDIAFKRVMSVHVCHV